MRALIAALIVAGLSCLIEVSAADVGPMVEPPGATIHPLCFTQLFAALRSDQPFHPVECEGLPGSEPVYIFPGQDAADLIYTALLTGDSGTSAGFVAYAVAGYWSSDKDNSEWTLFEVTTNQGGAGLFSSIWLLLKPDGSDAVEPLLYLPGGDRCNDGGLRVSEVGADRLVFMSAATPYRLLNPTGNGNWRSLARHAHGGQALNTDINASPPATASFLGWQPGQDVANGATACAGRLVKSYNFKTDRLDVLGVHIDQRAFLGAHQGRKQACINEWLSHQNFHRSGAYDGPVMDLDLSDWAQMLDSLESACAG